jgi:hypothetical protein
MVIAIIAVLTTILLPTARRAKEVVKRVICANNFKQIGISMHMCGDENAG